MRKKKIWLNSNEINKYMVINLHLYKLYKIIYTFFVCMYMCFCSKQIITIKEKAKNNNSNNARSRRYIILDIHVSTKNSKMAS